MKFFIKDFSSKCDQIRRKLRVWSHLLKKSLMEYFIFCAVINAICWRFEALELLDSKHFLEKKSMTRFQFISMCNFKKNMISFLCISKHDILILGDDYMIPAGRD